MNRIYKVIWSKVKNQYVVVSELAHSNGKQSSTSKISSVRGSLRAMLAALMVAGGIFSFTPAVYAAQANEASVSVLSDGIFWLQNGDNSIVIDKGNFDTYFVGAVRQADGTYTINGQVVSDKNLYNINDEIGAFVVDNNVYTGEVLDKDNHTVLSMQQRTIVNEDGFYAGNGKGTYNTLSKDGLWVGGTKDGEGFHVDNDGNVNTTGNVDIDGTLSAGNNEFKVDANGNVDATTVNASGLTVTDDEGNTNFQVLANGDVTAHDVTANKVTANNVEADIVKGNTVVGGILKNEDGSFTADANGNVDATTVNASGLTVTDEDGNTNFQVLANGDVTAHDITANNVEADVVKGNTVVGGTLKNEDGSFTADANGNVDATTVNASGLTVTDEDGNTNFQVLANGDVTAHDITANNVEADIVKGNTVVGGTLKNEDGSFTADANGNVEATTVNASGLTVTDDEGNTNFQVLANGDVTAHDVIANKVTANNVEADIVKGNTVVGGTLKNEDGSFTADANGNVDATTVNASGLTVTDEDGNTNFQVLANGTTKINNVVIGNEDSSAINVGDGNFVVYDGGSFQAAGRNFIVNQQGEMTAPKATIDDVVIDNNEITGLKNTEWTPNTVDYSNSDKAATEAQLKTVSDEAEKHTTVQSGKNVTVQENTTTDGHLDYTVNLNDDITLGDVNGNNIHLDGTNGNVTATGNITTKTGEVKANTFANTNGSFKVDGSGNVSAVDITSVGEVKANTFANTLGTFAVDADGNVTADDVTATGNITTETGEVKANTFANTGNTFSVNVDGDVGAVDVTATGDIKGKTLANTNGSFKVDENGDISSVGDITSTGEIEANTFANTLETFAVDVDGNVTAGSYKVGTVTYIDSNGINANSKVISNVAQGQLGTDAVNKDQLDAVEGKIKTYSEGNGIDINDTNTISVQLKQDEQNLVVDSTGLSLNPNLNVTSVSAGGVTVGAGKITGLTTASIVDNTDAANKEYVDTEIGKIDTASYTEGNGIDITDKAISVQLKQDEKNLVVDSTGLSLNPNLDITSVTASGEGNFKTMTIGEDFDSREYGISITGQKITGLNTASITDNEDAVNKEYVDKFFDPTKTGLAVQYDDKNKTTVTLDNSAGVEIKNVKTVDWLASSTSAANVGLVYSKAGSVDWNNTNFLDDTTDLTNAATMLDSKIGNLQYDGRYRLTSAQDTITDALNRLDASIGTLNFETMKTPYLGTADYQNATLAINQIANAANNIAGQIGLNSTDDKGLPGAIDWADSSIHQGQTIVGAIKDLDDYIGELNWDGTKIPLTTEGKTTSVVDAVKNLDGRVTTLETSSNAISDFSASNISTLNALSNMDMSTANTLASISPNALKAVANLSAENTVISDSEPATDSTTNSVPSRELENGNTGITTTKDAVTVDRNVTVNGDTTLNGDLNVRDNVSVGGTFEVDGKATFNNDVSIDGKLNMNNNVITGVADGKVSADSTEAINGSQLYAVEQRVDNNSQAINAVGNQVNRLSNRIDKVGAGAAALAALHPLDFDPDDKLSFAAGYGNYAGENAVAVGAFYQPNEDTMFSVGGTFGNDENMVNAGVSFKLGQKSNVSRSRVSMAKELVALRDEVAQLKALMAHAGVLPADAQVDTSALFPDVPQNHWAYECVHELGRLGILEGYADGNFEGDRMMTRYEMAAIVYRAMQKGVNIDSRMLKEFEPELKLIRVDVVARDDDGNPTIERVRVNEDVQQA